MRLEFTGTDVVLALTAICGPIALVWAMIKGSFDSEMGTEEEIPRDVEDD